MVKEQRANIPYVMNYIKSMIKECDKLQTKQAKKSLTYTTLYKSCNLKPIQIISKEIGRFITKFKGEFACHEQYSAEIA